MQVSNNTTSIQRLPDGLGSFVVLQPGHMENRENGRILVPGKNEVPSIMMDRVKECLGPVRWRNHARFINIDGDEAVPVRPTIDTTKLSAIDMIVIVKAESDQKKLIGYANNENLREDPRKTVVEAIEKRMIALSRDVKVEKKKKEKTDGEHE